VFGLIEAPDNGWTDPLTLAACVIAALLLAGFVAWERRSPHPMVQLAFFRNPRFSAASIASMLAFFSVFGTLFMLTQHLQFVLGYTPLQAGLRVMPVATLVVGAPLGARVAERLGTKAAVAAGFAVAAVGLWLISAADVDDAYGLVAWALGVLGCGMGLAMAPATDSIMGSMPTAKAGVGSAMNTTTRQVGGALGVAVLGSVLTSAYRDQVAPALGGLPAHAAALASDSVGSALGVAATLGPPGGELARAARAAFVDAMGTAALVGAVIALLGAMVALAFLPGAPTGGAGRARRDDTTVSMLRRQHRATRLAEAVRTAPPHFAVHAAGAGDAISRAGRPACQPPAPAAARSPPLRRRGAARAGAARPAAPARRCAAGG
jgi:hypothetical protein